MIRTIINHKWQCPKCNNWIGEDYQECAVCLIPVIDLKYKEEVYFAKSSNNYLKICEFCEKSFTTKRFYQKCCSWECQLKRRRKCARDWQSRHT